MSVNSFGRQVISVLGSPIPNTPHAVSVCLPAWQDNIDYEEGDPKVHSLLQSGYPRFVYHSSVKKVFKHCQRLIAKEEEDCLVFPSKRVAEEGKDFVFKYATNHKDIRVEKVHLGGIDVYVLVFPSEVAKVAKSFWQHSGEIISSRFADFLLRSDRPLTEGEEIDEYVEEHFGRNLSWASASAAKNALRRRISDLIHENKKNVFLFPCGMSAIYNAHRLVLKAFPSAKCVQLGFPYLDTLKILQKFGDGAYFLGNGDVNDLKQLEDILKGEKIRALFCEFPSNPLLKCCDLKYLKTLSEKYDFPIIVDDTLGNFLNIEVLPFADIVVSSLTKVFSGDSNVMGGSLVLNSQSKYYRQLSATFNEIFEDLVWSQDAIFLERNSRNFISRAIVINNTAEALCEYLRSHPKVERVHYPKFESKSIYDEFKKQNGGYGGLFSIILKDKTKAPLFYDSLAVCKGPSLGTNFTLCCPYTILAHYGEFDIVEQFGVMRELIRVSVGLETKDHLLQTFKQALEKI